MKFLLGNGDIVLMFVDKEFFLSEKDHLAHTPILDDKVIVERLKEWFADWNGEPISC